MNNHKTIREMIIDTYANFKMTPANFLHAILHFNKICRFAMIGLKVAIVYGISFDTLEQERKRRQLAKKKRNFEDREGNH